MRRLWGGLLLGLGVFLLVLAGMFRFFVADRAVQTPVDQFVRTVATGNGTYLDVAAVAAGGSPQDVQKSADLVAIRTLRGNVDASTDKVGVWDVNLTIQTAAGGSLVQAFNDRVAFDRKTGESVACCEENVDGDDVRHEGLSYKFPFDTEKKTYTFWNVSSKKSYDAKYVSEEKVQGLTTYKFVQEIPGEQLRTEQVPGALVGESAPVVEAAVWYTNTRTVWVEPTTGVIVKGSEANRTTLRDSSGADKATVLDVTFTFDEPTQKSQAKLARDGIGDIHLVTRWVPLLGLLLGLLAIVAGLVLLRDRGTPPPGDDDRTREITPAEPTPPAAARG